MSAQMLKKNTENQSMAAAVLRCRVGSAKDASTASGGRASINARSEPPMATQAATLTRAHLSGTAICRRSRWCLQRQSVHSASNHAGHMNHTSRRPSESTWALDRYPPKRHAQASSSQAAKAASAVPSAIQLTNRRAGAWSEAQHTTMPTKPSESEMVGAPLADSAGRATSTATRGVQPRNGVADNA